MIINNKEMIMEATGLKIKDIEIIMFPANSGDCILIHFIKKNFRILIDGGYICTYDQYLKPYLKKIGKEGARLNLIIATHIDRDHINGIKKLLEENGDYNNPKIIKIEEIWFNGFQNLPIKKESPDTEIPKLERDYLYNMAGNNLESITNGSENVSYRDGNCLADLIVRNGYIWNKPFQRAVSADDRSYVDYEGISINILNPCMRDLERLAQKWISELERKSKKIVISENHLFENAFEGCFNYDYEFVSHVENVSFHSEDIIDWHKEADQEEDYSDGSVQNLSSIAVMIKYDDITLLFPGDCPMIKLKERIPLKITAVELSHHGSGKSNDISFIRNTEVSYYLLSTDGKKGHPSKRIIGNILCHAKGSPLLVTNYKIPMLNGIRCVVENWNDE